MKAPLKTGQALQHSRFGVGIATRSDEARTTIDFYDHGVKVFVTDMLEVELMAQAPPRPEPVRAPRAPRAKKKP